MSLFQMVGLNRTESFDQNLCFLKDVLALKSKIFGFLCRPDCLYIGWKYRRHLPLHNLKAL